MGNLATSQPKASHNQMSRFFDQKVDDKLGLWDHLWLLRGRSRICHKGAIFSLKEQGKNGLFSGLLGIKDASDKKILVDMLFWAIDNPPPANYLLISGDRDFSNAIHKLKMKRYNILLAQPPNVSHTLTAAAKSVWLWKSLLAGEPPLAKSPYVSSTSSGNKDDLDTSKNIVSNSSNATRDINPQVKDVLCDHQSGASGKADKQDKVKQPQEMQTDNVSKLERKKNQKRCNPGGLHSTEQPKSKRPKTLQKPVKGVCYKCGDGHHFALECPFTGDCYRCGQPGHRDRVCRQNPNSILKREIAHAKVLATSSPGSVQITGPAPQLHPTCSPPSGCSLQETPAVPSPPPATPIAPVPPQMDVRASSSPPHSGVDIMPITASLGSADVTQPASSAPSSHKPVPAYRPVSGQGMICFKCGAVGHRAFKCNYNGSCHYCGQVGHTDSVCKENPDNIIKREPVHERVLATSSLGSVHVTAPASQLHQTSTPPPWWFLQATPAVTTPTPATSVTPAPAHPSQGGSAPRPPMANDFFSRLLSHAGFSAPGQYRQVGGSAYTRPNGVVAAANPHDGCSTSQVLPAWAPPPGCVWQPAPIVPSPLPAPHVAFEPPQPGVAASSAPANSGVYAMPFPFGRPW